eukprot:257882-Chlamydomonas_euryale.AAC.3
MRHTHLWQPHPVVPHQRWYDLTAAAATPALLPPSSGRAWQAHGLCHWIRRFAAMSRASSADRVKPSPACERSRGQHKRFLGDPRTCRIQRLEACRIASRQGLLPGSGRALSNAQMLSLWQAGTEVEAGADLRAVVHQRKRLVQTSQQDTASTSHRDARRERACVRPQAAARGMRTWRAALNLGLLPDEGAIRQVIDAEPFASGRDVDELKWPEDPLVRRGGCGAEV